MTRNDEEAGEDCTASHAFLPGQEGLCFKLFSFILVNFWV